jgi:hypothetical protein
MQDAEEFKNQYPRYHADIGGETRKAITALTTSEGVKDRYSDFVAAMVYGEKPDFEIAVATSRALVEKAWPEPASSDTPS